MTKLLLKLPWFLSAPAVVLVAGLFAGLAYAFTGDYFNETCVNERNPLTGDFAPSNCGEGAKVAKRLAEGGPTATTTMGQPGGQVSAPRTGTTEPTRTPGTATASAATATPGTQAPSSPSPSSTASTTAPATTATASSTSAATTTPPAPSPTPTRTPTPTATAPVATATPTPATGGAGVLARGQFRDGDPGHTGKGTVELQRLADGSLNAFLSNFSVTNGPDLFVVLSESADGDYSGGDLVLQPRLKANNGNQNYVIPAGTDVSRFRSVIIWCKAFDVTFAYAILGGAQ